MSNREGGFVCEKHLNGLEPFSVERLRKFRLIIKGEFKDYSVLKDFEYDINDFYMIVNFYIQNADLRIKAYDFYKGMN